MAALALVLGVPTSAEPSVPEAVTSDRSTAAAPLTTASTGAGFRADPVAPGPTVPSEGVTGPGLDEVASAPEAPALAPAPVAPAPGLTPNVPGTRPAPATTRAAPATTPPAPGLTPNAPGTPAAAPAPTSTPATTPRAAAAPAATGVPSATPRYDEVKLVARAGGDRLADGSVAGLPGATFTFYRTSSTAVTGGTAVGTCTTGRDGRCGVIVDLPFSWLGYYGYFYAVQTGTPAGWTAAESWGAAQDLVRHATGYVRGGATVALPDDGRGWPNVRANAATPARCTRDVAVVYDLSGAVTRGESLADFGAYRDAGRRVVDALEGTASHVALYGFASEAPAPGFFNRPLPLTSVRSPAGATVVRAALRLFNPAPLSSTNWDAGLAQVAAGADVVVFLTAGEPTASRSGSGGAATMRTVEDAVASANMVKAAGAHLVAVGVGAARTPVNQQRLRLLTDDTRVTDVAGLGDVLASVARVGCTGTVNVVTEVRRGPGARPTPGRGWRLTPAAAGPGRAPVPAVTGDDGAASFAVDLEQATGSRTLTLTQASRQGYVLEPQGGQNATCTSSDGSPVVVTNVSDGFAVEARPDAVITCRVINAVVERPSVTIVKTSALDPADGGEPTVTAGTSVTWSYTVTNTGTVPLTHLRVTDDRGVAVTCPRQAGGPASGNPIPHLSPGESTTCVATGPVTPLPTS